MSEEKRIPPGYRWLRCDLHTHTPVSCDTPEMNGVSETEWLTSFMKHRIDLVAITDHNTGRWIDSLKHAYSNMKCNNSSFFRPIILIPGVEITTADGIHLLALFDLKATTSFIEDFLTLLGSPVETRGDSSCIAGIGTFAIIKLIIAHGGLAIPAHIDRKRGKGLLNLEPGLLIPILESNEIQVVESLSERAGWPPCGKTWRVVAGSDSHMLSSEDPYSRFPGCIYTKIFMKSGALQDLVQALGRPKGICRVIPEHYIE